MNLPAGAMIGALRGIAGYQPLFASAFPRRGLTPETVAEAIATYERTIVSSSAPFDAWLDGDEAAISAAAQRGFLLFNTKAGCASCHAGWLFTDEGFHDIGLPGSLRGGLPDTDDGRGALLPHIGKMRHAFKTPGLREVAVRGPYMHDGSLPTLEAVVAHYDRGGEDRPSKSRSIVPLGLSAGDQADLVAFLRTLTSPVASNVIPALPR
jgi:cytochrome c peroxidase